jgi:hypothetical protein
LILKTLLEAKKAIGVVPENSILEISKHKMMAYFERLREQFGTFSCREEDLHEVETTYPAEEREPSILTTRFSSEIAISLHAIFHPELLF